jgi:hypothetical protein
MEHSDAMTSTIRRSVSFIHICYSRHGPLGLRAKKSHMGLFKGPTTWCFIPMQQWVVIVSLVAVASGLTHYICGPIYDRVTKFEDYDKSNDTTCWPEPIIYIWPKWQDCKFVTYGHHNVLSGAILRYPNGTTKFH